MFPSSIAFWRVNVSISQMKNIFFVWLLFVGWSTFAQDGTKGVLCERVHARVKSPLPPGYRNSGRAALADRGIQQFTQRMMNIKGADKGVYWIGVSPQHEEIMGFIGRPTHQVVVTRPDLIAAALKSPELVDRSYDASKSLSTKAGQDSILLLPDSKKESALKWQLAHKALVPFFRPRYLEDVVGPVVRDNAQAMVENWLSSDRQTVSINSDIEFYALNNVFAPLFEQPLRSPLSTELIETLQMFFSPSPPAEAKAARRRFEDLVKPSVALAMRGRGAPLLKQLRIVQQEHDLPKSWIYDQLITLYFAGQVTTKTMLIMSLYHLAEYPQYQEQIRNEYREWREGRGGLELTRRFIQETLRLYPPVPVLHRYTTASIRLGDYIIPKHTAVTLNLYAGFIRPETWGADVTAFRPERFETQSIKRHDLCVFGYGPRICIGQNLAIQEAEILLGELLLRASISRVGNFSVPDLENTGLLYLRDQLKLKIDPL